MKIKYLKSQFAFNRSQRIGILLLLFLIVGLLNLNFFISFSKPSSLDVYSEEIKELQSHLDSLRKEALEIKKPKRYAFNPNFITDFKAYTLGLSPAEFDRLKSYRDKGLWINSASQFQGVTKVSDSILEEIRGLFKFPEWVTSAKPRKKWNSYKTGETNLVKTDLNTATKEELQTVHGVGEVLSRRIIEKRNSLGEFSNENELYTIWGLHEEVINRILLQFEVTETRAIIKLNVNKCSASDIATLPGISFELGKQIWEFVRLREGIIELSELNKIEGLTPRKFKVIELYLYAE